MATSKIYDSAPHGLSAKRSDRMRRILSILSEREWASVDLVASVLRVSAATIRRDLADLDSQGLIVRTHGGARRYDSRNEIPVALRNAQFRGAKLRIARFAAGLIPRGPYAVAISGGATAAEVARALGNRSELTIITNALTIAVEAAALPNLKVIITGGILRLNSFEAVGPLSEGVFMAMNVDTVILGTDGISATGGVTTHDITAARTNNAMVEHAQRIIVVADGSKIGRVALAKMADLSDIHEVVTDSSAEADALKEIADAGVTVHVVEDV